MVLGAIVNGINSLISLSVASLLVYRNATDLCALVFVPCYFAEFRYQFQQPFGGVFRVFHVESILSSAKSESLTSLPIFMPFISFCCLIANARTSNIMLNNSGESGHFCCVPDLMGKAFSFSPLRILAVALSYMAFMMLRYVSPIPTFLRVFNKKGCYIL